MNPQDDFELWMWASMTAATNALNAALHASGLTQEDDAYSYNAVGIYVVPPKILHEWRKELRPLGDLIHITLSSADRKVRNDRRPAPLALPPALNKAAEHVQILEDFRDSCVRGMQPITATDVAQCQSAFDDALHLFSTFIKDATGRAI
jgi:hypothetical protein